MNIHLVNDEKFINLSIIRFEYYYPNDNIFIVNSHSEKIQDLIHVKKRKEIICINLYKNDAYKKLINHINNGDNILIHSLSLSKASLINKIELNTKINTYWIFYGAFLYSILFERGLYKLYDYNPNSLKIENRFYWHLKYKFRYLKYVITLFVKKENREINKFIQNLDFFCFWNYSDYDLLLKNFQTKAKFKFFRYYDIKEEFLLEESNVNKEKNSVLINHSASPTGNHLYILRLLKKIDKNKQIDKLYLPLSYGSETLKKNVLFYGNKEFDYCFNPILEFMDRIDYYQMLKKIGVAFFGHRRQEGGSNIFFLLAFGVKLFLRKENSLLNYLKQEGFIVYEVEKDLYSFSDISPLNEQDQKYNRELVLKHFSNSKIDKTYLELFR